MAESRWITEFKQHPFQGIWQQLKAHVEGISTAALADEVTVLEIARLKRVVSYLDTLLASLDPELVPRANWGNFHSQVEQCLQHIVAYKSNANLKLIRAANDHLDNLLSYVRPYEVPSDEERKSLVSASRSFAQEMRESVDAFKGRANAILAQLEEDRSAAAQDRSATDKSRKRVDALFTELFVGTGDEKPVESKITDLLASTKVNSKAIEDLHAALLVGTPQSLSIQARVKSAEVEVESTRDKLNSLLDGAQVEVRTLAAFHEKIFGKKDESGKVMGGLDAELDARQIELKRLEQEQSIKHAALVARIESLLPGATSAGLATSYKTLKDNFIVPIARYTGLFYASLGLLVAAAMIMVVDSISVSPFSLKLVEVKEWDWILKALIYKVPFVAPVVWLAIFSSTRRSQYERLQQEYAHKEAFASSYESYKRQLEALKTDGDGLQRELIAKAIEAIAYNASITLDGKHEDKLPAQQIWEKLSVDELKKFAEFVKTLKAA